MHAGELRMLDGVDGEGEKKGEEEAHGKRWMLNDEG
jgi:hypothetical protein